MYLYKLIGQINLILNSALGKDKELNIYFIDFARNNVRKTMKDITSLK